MPDATRMPPIMTPGDFITKWRTAELKERSGSQEYFIDLCHLFGEPTPADADPAGGWHCFERGARKDSRGSAQSLRSLR